MAGIRRTARDFGGLAFVAALLVLVNLLPPDTSLHEVRAVRMLRVCVPLSYPPLVTGDPERPGIDIELLEAVADRLGVTLSVNQNQAMGRDFNPRNWGLTRAQCQVVAGGVVDSPLTRSFLETGPPYAETGWAVLAPERLSDLRGRNIGAMATISGLDRISLSSYLRSQDVNVGVVPRPDELVSGIAEGRFDGGITEALLASQLAADNGWSATLLPVEFSRYNLVFGLWKGDLTLKRAIVSAIEELADDGTMTAILARYGATPID